MDLNYSPVHFDNDSYTIFRIDYESPEQLTELRSRHNKTNSFFRDGNFIYHSPMEEEEVFLEGTQVTLSIQNDIGISKKLFHHLVFRTILKENVIISEYSPIEFFIKDKNYDLLKSIIDEKVGSKVGYWKGFKIDTRVLKNNDSLTYGLVLNIFHSWKVRINCQLTIEKGISIIDRYVEIYDNEIGSIFNRTRKLVGQVVSFDEKYAIVKKGTDENRYLISELYLENSARNIQDILEKFVGTNKASDSFKLLSSTSQDRSGAEGKWKSITNFLDWVKTLSFTNHNGFSFKITNFLTDSDAIWNQMNIAKPTFIFNSLNTQKDMWHDRGLREFGPYSKTNFTPSTPLIAVVFRKDNRGQVSKFMGKFKDGLPDINQGNYKPYGQGFALKYRLSNIDIRPYPVEDSSIASYEKAIRHLIEEIGDKVDLVFIESCEDYKTLSPHMNPYFFAKAQLLKQGIPSQVALYENMCLPDRRLAFILNNISLASYAKIGGIPWVTPSDASVEHELVIGIGNKIFKEDRFSLSRRIVGITTLFSGDGNYILSNTSKDVPYEEYLNELKTTLTINIDKVRKKYNWLPGDTVRLVFHVFKPFREDEITAVERTVEDLQKEFNVLFAYINIVENHPFLLIDKSQKGVNDISNYGKLKGIWQPMRAINLKIDKNQFLLQLIGPNEIKTYKQGMAAPVIVKLHEKSSFTDIDYLTRQVFYFSCISWRGFLPASLPVTLEYSNQIAKILGNLRTSGYWDNDLLPTKLNTKAWFL